MTKPRGFSLVELMVSVAILSVGIVLVIRSFLLTAWAQDIAMNTVRAAYLADNVMGELEGQAMANSGLDLQSHQEPVAVNSRAGVLASEVAAVDDEALETLVEARCAVMWNDGRGGRQAGLVGYMKKKSPG
ncbi:MAG: hypothetical protein A3D28_05270 [Omnitrophica bacterium RIFCSPHIGHO2_02_FULL_63_14]|nr:MAG: hypothetical protein A3D28_05270 [Omnitrophica bacterium RIFCSPHIGHO2_02_FULL_63_14]